MKAGPYVVQVHVLCRSKCGTGPYVVLVHLWCKSICGTGPYVVQVHMWCLSICDAGPYVVHCVFDSIKIVFKLLNQSRSMQCYVMVNF